MTILSVESKLLEISECSKKILALSHPSFSMSFQGDELMFDIKKGISRFLYNADIIEWIEETTISAMDVILSDNTAGSFDWVEMGAKKMSKILEDYDVSDDQHQLFLLCYICYNYFRSRFKDMNKLSDITRPVPIQFFVSIINKDKTHEVMYKDREECEYAGVLEKVLIRRSMFSAKLVAFVHGI